MPTKRSEHFTNALSVNFPVNARYCGVQRLKRPVVSSSLWQQLRRAVLSSASNVMHMRTMEYPCSSKQSPQQQIHCQWCSHISRGNFCCFVRKYINSFQQFHVNDMVSCIPSFTCMSGLLPQIPNRVIYEYYTVSELFINSCVSLMTVS